MNDINETGKWYFASVIVKNTMYFHAHNGYLMKMEKGSNTLEIILCADSKHLLQKYKASVMLQYDNSIYLFDDDGKGIFRYRIRENICDEVINIESRLLGEYGALVDAKVINGVIYAFYSKGQKYIEIRDENATINDIPEDLVEFEWEKVCVCYMRENAYFLFPNNKNVVLYSYANKSFTSIKVSEDFGDCIATYAVENEMYVLSDSGTYYVWDVSRNTIKKITFVCGRTIKHFEWYRIIRAGEFVYVLPGYGEELFVIDKDSRVTVYRDYPEGFHCILSRSASEKYGKYVNYTEDNDRIFFAARYYSHILAINKRSGHIEWIELIPPDIKEELIIYLNDNRVVTERKRFLESWLELLEK